MPEHPATGGLLLALPGIGFVAGGILFASVGHHEAMGISAMFLGIALWFWGIFRILR